MFLSASVERFGFSFMRDFYVRNANLLSSNQLKTYDNFSLSFIRGGRGGGEARVYSGSPRRIIKEPHTFL